MIVNTIAHATEQKDIYEASDGKLWCILNSKSIHSKLWLKCVSQTEAIKLAQHKHTNNSPCTGAMISWSCSWWIGCTAHSLSNPWLLCSSALNVRTLNHHTFMHSYHIPKHMPPFLQAPWGSQITLGVLAQRQGWIPFSLTYDQHILLVHVGLQVQNQWDG